MGEAWIMSQHIPGDKSRSDLGNLHELRGKRLVAQVSQTRQFKFYLRTGVVLMLQLESSCHGRSVDHVSKYSGRQIVVGSHKPSRITRQKTCCASESNRSVCVVFANRSGFDGPIGVILASEERGSCLNIFRTTNPGRISETFTNYEANFLLRTSVDHVSTYSGRQIAVGSQKPSRITRQNTCCARAWILSQRIPDDKSLSDLRNLHELRGKRLVAQIMSQHIPDDKSRSDLKNLHELRGKRLVANLLELRGKRRVAQLSQTGRFALYSRIGVVLMLQLESSWHVTSVDHVSTYFERKIAVGSQKPSRIMRQKACCASESNTSVRVVFANRSGFDAPIGVVFAWEERGSCLNIFRTTNHGGISETFTNYEAKDLLRAWIMSQHIPNDKSRSDLRNLHELQGKRLVAEERGSCLNIFRMKNHGRISETFTNYDAKDLLNKHVDHVSTSSGRKIAWDLRNLYKLRGKSLVAQVSQTCRFAYQSGFDAPIGVVLALEERGSCLNIFRTTNCSRISETFMNYEAKDLLRNWSRLGMGGAWIMSQHITDKKSRSDLRNLHELRGKRLVTQESQTRCFALYPRTGVVMMLQFNSSWQGRSVDHVSTSSERQIAVRSQKPSRITRQKTCCALESNTSVRVVFANRSGFKAPIGVFLAWEERGSCLNIFRTTNRGRISETFTNYEAKDLLHE
ncbi:uncharacterized protein G2W53_033675 [Senna tora]|uniref:Uncharacterized protein n=1 Tax=Senna tora TaxID=362788 RepID=A0A834T9W5_9FABA|nr:uncharacterized protein G2W53_033675 [Senna tora]